MMFGRLSLLSGGGGGNVDVHALLASKGVPFGLWDFVRTDLTYQGTAGVTAADDNGEAVALALGTDQIDTLTLAEAKAAATELRPTGAPALVGSATAATFDTSSGAGAATRVDSANQSYVTFAVTAGWYWIEFTADTGVSTVVRNGNQAGTILQNIPPGGGYSGLVQITGSALSITTNGTGSITFTLASLKLIAGHHAVQTGSTGYRPTRQAVGVKGDALDDFLRSTLKASASADTLLIDADVPASISAFGAALGLNGSGGTSRLFLGFQTTGFLVAGVGTQSVSTITGAADYRSTRVQAALAFGSSSVRMRVAGVNVYGPAASAGAPDTANAFDLWSVNANGTAGSFGGVTLRRAAAIQADLSDAEIDRILNKWGSS